MKLKFTWDKHLSIILQRVMLKHSDYGHYLKPIPTQPKGGKSPGLPCALFHYRWKSHFVYWLPLVLCVGGIRSWDETAHSHTDKRPSHSVLSVRECRTDWVYIGLPVELLILQWIVSECSVSHCESVRSVWRFHRFDILFCASLLLFKKKQFLFRDFDKEEHNRSIK